MPVSRRRRSRRSDPVYCVYGPVDAQSRVTFTSFTERRSTKRTKVLSGMRRRTTRRSRTSFHNDWAHIQAINNEHRNFENRLLFVPSPRWVASLAETFPFPLSQWLIPRSLVRHSLPVPSDSVAIFPSQPGPSNRELLFPTSPFPQLL